MEYGGVPPPTNLTGQYQATYLVKRPRGYHHVHLLPSVLIMGDSNYQIGPNRSKSDQIGDTQ